MRRTYMGFTLIELIITITMLTALMGTTVFVFRAALLSWSSQETRTGIDISLGRGIEEAARDLREAKQISSVNNDEIRFTQDETNFYIYYFYNGSDSYPPIFSQNLYELRKAVLSGGIDGTFTYNSGAVKMTDVLPPAISDLSISGNLVAIDLTVKRKDETIRSKTQVRPRNL